MTELRAVVEAAGKIFFKHFDASNAEERIYVGLGTGKTVSRFLEDISKSETLKGQEMRIFPTSSDTLLLILNLKLNAVVENLLSLGQSRLGFHIDGYDTVITRGEDKYVALIKGGGGALTLEKLVLSHCEAGKACFIGVSSKKRSAGDGKGVVSIPLEILPEAMAGVQRSLELRKMQVTLRASSGGKAGPVVTDNGLWLLDAQMSFDESTDWITIEQDLQAIPGVLCCGIFAESCREREAVVLVGEEDGSVSRLCSHNI